MKLTSRDHNKHASRQTQKARTRGLSHFDSKREAVPQIGAGWARTLRTTRTSQPLRPSTRSLGSMRGGTRLAGAWRQASPPWASRLGSSLGPSPMGVRRSLSSQKGPWVRVPGPGRSPTPPPPISARAERALSAIPRPCLLSLSSLSLRKISEPPEPYGSTAAAARWAASSGAR